MEIFALSILIGVFTGIIASSIVWWYLFHVLTPKIEFSEKISKIPSEDRGCRFLYRIKFHNARKRIVINLILKLTIVLPDFPKKGTNVLYNIPLGAGHITHLFSIHEKGRVRRITLFMLDTEEFTKIFESRNFSDKIHQLAQEKKLSLEDLFDITDNSFIRMSIIATDSVSGSTKLFLSKKYYKNDIVFGNFDESSLRVIPFTS